jgi:hypothetical protein
MLPDTWYASLVECPSAPMTWRWLVRLDDCGAAVPPCHVAVDDGIMQSILGYTQSGPFIIRFWHSTMSSPAYQLLQISRYLLKGAIPSELSVPRTSHSVCQDDQQSVILSNTCFETLRVLESPEYQRYMFIWCRNGIVKLTLILKNRVP